MFGRSAPARSKNSLGFRGVFRGGDSRPSTNSLIQWWALQGLNLRPLPCEENALQKNSTKTTRVSRVCSVLARPTTCAKPTRLRATRRHAWSSLHHRYADIIHKSQVG